MLRRALVLLAFALVAAACGTKPADKLPPGDQDDFTSAAVGGSAGGREAADAPGAANASGGGTPRTVEEGDVYKLVGDELYILNMYRGLQVVNVANPDRPVKQGTSPIFGYPVEMYVRDGYAYVIVSDYYTWWQVADGPAQPFHGSQVRIVDVRRPEAPVVVGGIDLDGAVSDTRIVGDVLYVVANRWSWYSNAGSSDNVDALVVSSIDLANPAAPQLKEHLEFTGTSNVIHVSPTTLYVASPDGTWQSPRTNVAVVDIDDPHGHLAAKGSLTVDGYVEQRFQLDEFAGNFRIVTHSGSWGQDGTQTLNVFQLAPQTRLLSTFELANTGGLFATRFDGDRAYLVTMVSRDPLDIIDLRDPANPTLAHSLVIPGVLHQIAPRGDRLLALGTDDRWSGVAASLFDVADPQHPSLLGRVQIGGGSSWSNANWDDKALKVLDAAHMMLVPFSGWQADAPNDSGRYVNGFQIVSFDRQHLTADGIVEQDGQVSRVTSHGARLLSLSDRVLQSVNASDRANPQVTARLELARDVNDFAAVGGRAVTLSTSGWWWDSATTELRVAPLSNPEDGTTGRLELPFRGSRLIADGTNAIVVGYPQQWDGTSLAARVDLSDPTRPALAGEPVAFGSASNQTSSFNAYPDSAILARAGLLAVPAWESRQVTTDRWETTSSVVLVDVVRGTQTRVDLPGSLAGDLLVDGATLWTSHQEVVSAAGNQPVARFYADRIDLTDPARPTLLAKVNIPGTLVGVAGATLFTRDYQWLADGHVQHSLAEVTLSGSRAHLRRYVPLDDGLGRIIADGRRLYATTQQWWWNGAGADGVTLRVYESTDAAPLAEVSRTPVRDWMQLRSVAGGHLFLGTGYWGGPWELGDMMRGGGMAGDVAPGGMGGYGYGFIASNGLLDYSLADATHPAYRQYVRTNGWVQGLAVDGGRLYVSGGIYGIQSVALVR